MKWYNALMILIVIVIALILLLPRSCNTKTSPLNIKSNHAFIIDSLQRVHAIKLKNHSDSLIFIHEKKDSIAQVKITSITKDYNRLRAIVKDLTSVKVDSSTQVVIITVEQYNAFVESGNKCDSIQDLKDVRLLEKDSINSELKGQVKIEQDLNTTTKQALADYIKLSKEEENKLEKSKKSGKIKYILGFCTIPAVYVISKVLHIF